MTTFQLTIEPVSPGTRGDQGLKNGDASYSTTPQGKRVITIPMTQAQIAGVQGYLTLIKAGTSTASIETAITAVGPT